MTAPSRRPIAVVMEPSDDPPPDTSMDSKPMQFRTWTWFRVWVKEGYSDLAVGALLLFAVAAAAIGLMAWQAASDSHLVATGVDAEALLVGLHSERVASSSSAGGYTYHFIATVKVARGNDSFTLSRGVSSEVWQRLRQITGTAFGGDLVPIKVRVRYDPDDLSRWRMVDHEPVLDEFIGQCWFFGLLFGIPAVLILIRGIVLGHSTGAS
ncbi:MAG: hypothetical protein AB7K09_04765 [Planctomycetota bacterium]